MVRGRRGPTLIELIDKGDAPGTLVPKWWQERRKEEAPKPSTGESQPAASSRAQAPISEWDAPRQVVSVRGDRLVVSLSSVWAGVFVFALILLVGSGYLLGRRQGRSDGLVEGFERGKASVGAGALSEIEAARKSAPNREIFDGLASNPVSGNKTVAQAPAGEASSDSRAAAGDPGQSGWVKDHTYIVVQEFKAGDRSDAEAAKLFLAQNGVETVILESTGSYRYRLVATKGFNRDDPAQRKWCDDYHERIRKLGEEFVKAGGRYDLQGYQKRLTGDRW